MGLFRHTVPCFYRFYSSSCPSVYQKVQTQFDRAGQCSEITMASKTFSFQDYDAVGVDLDHTLCKYNLDTTLPLIYDSLIKVYVEDFGYSKSLLEPFDQFKDFITKGLVLDVANGNFLKLSGDGVVLRATHGTKPLTDDELHSYYGKERQWEHFAPLKETLKQTEFVRYFENYFDMPIGVFSARLIDYMDEEAGKRQEKYTLSSKMVEALNKVFNREHYQDGTSHYFSSVRANPSTYLQPCSDTTKQWLRNLKASGKTVFLKTSSHVDYAILLLEFILGSDWESYFDVCIMYARKPGFFTAKSQDRPFYTIKDLKEDEAVTEIHSHNCYLQGNINIFNKYLQKTTGKDNPKVMYVGDSVRSDVWPTNIYAKWSSIVILEEMEAEGMIEDSCEEPLPKMAKMAKGLSTIEREFLLSDLWGSFFVDSVPNSGSDSSSESSVNNSKSTVLTDTLWGHFVKAFSTIAVPTIEHVAAFPLDHEFKTFSSDGTSTAGFYPGRPCAFKQ